MFQHIATYFSVDPHNPPTLIFLQTHNNIKLGCTTINQCCDKSRCVVKSNLICCLLLQQNALKYCELLQQNK